jgi:hypothetical protein
MTRDNSSNKDMGCMMMSDMMTEAMGYLAVVVVVVAELHSMQLHGTSPPLDTRACLLQLAGHWMAVGLGWMHQVAHVQGGQVVP